MRALFLLLCIVALLASFGVSEGADRVAVFKMSTNSGETVQPSGGVSLMGTIKVAQSYIEGGYSFHPYIIYYGDGTKESTKSGATAIFSLATSNTTSPNGFTEAQWEALGIAGVSEFACIAVNSGSSQTPVEFYPPHPVGWVAVFVHSESYAFKVPQGLAAAQ